MFGRATITLGIGPHSSFDMLHHVSRINFMDVLLHQPHPSLSVCDSFLHVTVTNVIFLCLPATFVILFTVHV